MIITASLLFHNYFVLGGEFADPAVSGALKHFRWRRNTTVKYRHAGGRDPGAAAVFVLVMDGWKQFSSCVTVDQEVLTWGGRRIVIKRFVR